MFNLKRIENADRELYNSLMSELKRQRQNLELIASENFVTENVLSVAGCHLTNKYARAIPAKDITAAASLSTRRKHWR